MKSVIEIRTEIERLQRVLTRLDKREERSEYSQGVKKDIALLNWVISE